MAGGGAAIDGVRVDGPAATRGACGGGRRAAGRAGVGGTFFDRWPTPGNVCEVAPNDEAIGGVAAAAEGGCRPAGASVPKGSGEVGAGGGTAEAGLCLSTVRLLDTGGGATGAGSLAKSLGLPRVACASLAARAAKSIIPELSFMSAGDSLAGFGVAASLATS